MSDLLAAVATAGGFIVYWFGALAMLYLPLALAYPFWERRLLARAAGYAPSVSVLVPAFNEEATILDSVRSILAADYPDFEVIVIDDGSTDGTVERLAAFASQPRLRLLRQANGGKGAALNAGLAVARGELTLFTDADALFEPDTIRQAARYFADPAVGAMGGNDTPLHPHGWLQQLLVVTSHIGTGYVRRALSMLRVLPIIPGNLGVVRTAILRELGGFLAVWGEDLELTWRLHRHGVRIVYGARARVLAECPSTLRSLWRQRVRWIRSYLKVLRENRDMIARPRYGRFGLYLLINVANGLFVPLLQLALLVALPWLFARGVIASGLPGLLAIAGIGWLYMVAVIAILLDRSPRHFVHLPFLILLVPLSQLYSAIVAWSVWAEWRARPEQWLKSARRDPQVAAEQVRVDAGRRGVVLAGASALAVAGTAALFGTTLTRQRPAQAAARVDGLQIAIGMHFPDWPDWRQAYRSLLEQPELAAVQRVALSAGRADWTFFRSGHGRQWWSRDQLREPVDMLAEAADALHARGLATTAMLDVFAPRWLERNPGHAAHDTRGRVDKEIVCSTSATAGPYRPFLVEALDALAAGTSSDSVAVTELFYDSKCFCERCLASFRAATARESWPRRRGGAIDLVDPALGDWRSRQVAGLVQELRAAAHRHGKTLAVDVRLSREDLSRNSRENGQDYQLLRAAADELVVWDYFALDNIAPSESQAVARHAGAQFGRTPWWHSIGLWDRFGQTVPAEQMRLAMDAAIRGGARRLWITPGKRLDSTHWQQIAALAQRAGATT